MFNALSLKFEELTKVAEDQKTSESKLTFVDSKIKISYYLLLKELGLGREPKTLFLPP